MTFLNGTSAIDIDYTDIMVKLQEVQDSCSLVPDRCGLDPPNLNTEKQYIEANSFEELMKMDQITYNHPDDIVHAARKARQRLYFGIFTEIDLQYCIIDNKLHYWRKGSTIYHTLKYNNIISAIFLFKDMLLIGCEYSLYIHMINLHLWHKNSQKYFPHENEISKKPYFYSENIGFYISALTASSINDIYAGSDNGSVYSIIIERDYIHSKIFPTTPIISCLSEYVTSLFPKFLQINYPISNIVYDETTNILASVDTASNIRFFHVENNKNSVEFFDLYSIKKDKIISIIPVPISDSKVIRFIVFFESGKRNYIGQIFNPISKKHSMEIIYSRPPPPNFKGPAIEAISQLGRTVILTKSRIYIIKSEIDLQNPSNLCETCFCEIIPYVGLSISTKIHNLRSISTGTFRHSSFWQNICNQFPINVITSGLMFTIKFHSNSHDLYNLLLQSNGNFTEQISKYFIERKYFCEAGQTAVFLATRCDWNIQKMILFTLAQVAKNSLQKIDILPKSDGLLKSDNFTNNFYFTNSYKLKKISKNMKKYSMEIDGLQNVTFKNLTFASNCFLYQMGHYLAVPWSFPVFKTNHDGYIIINHYLSISFQYSIDYFKKLSELMKKFVYLLRQVCNEEELALLNSDLIFLQKLTEFSNLFLETIILLSIISEQKMETIDKTFKEINDTSISDRLRKVPFCCLSSDKTVFECLREFCWKLIMKNPRLGYRVIRETPNYFSVDDFKILMSISELLTIKDENDGKINRIVQNILQNINRKFDLKQVFDNLIRLNKFNEAVTVILQKVTVVDIDKIALKWYKNGCNSYDTNGRFMFDKVYICYNFVLEIVDENNLKRVLSFDDELFHYCLYKKLMSDQNMFTSLLINSTPFLLNFLKTQKLKKEIWKYYFNRKEIPESVSELLKLLSSHVLTQIEREELIEKGILICQSFNLTNFLNEFEKLKIIEKVTKIYCQRTHFHIKGKNMQHVLEKVTKKKFWDLCLMLINDYPVENKNNVLSQVWTNFLVEKKLPQSEIEMKVIKFCMDLGTKGDIFNVEIVLPIFEEYKMNRKFDVLWVTNLMIESGFDKKEMYKIYMKLLENRNMSLKIRSDFTYSALKVAEMTKIATEDDKNKLRKYLSESTTTESYYNDCLNILNCLY